MSFALLGILQSQAAGGANVFWVDTQAATVPSGGSVGASGGIGSSSYFFKMRNTSNTQGFYVSADGNNWTTLGGFPASMSSAPIDSGTPSHENISGKDVYVFGVEDNNVNGNWLMWYEADPTFPGSATWRGLVITYGVSTPFYGMRTYHTGTTVVGSVWGLQQQVRYARLQTSSGGGTGSGNINNLNGGYPNYEPYGHKNATGTMQFSWSGNGSDYYLNEVYSGSTASNPFTTSQLVSMPDWQTIQPFYVRLADGTKLIASVFLTDQQGYVFSGSTKPSNGFSPSSNTVWRTPTQSGSTSRPVLLPDNQTLLFVENGGEDIYVTTDLVTYELYAGIPDKASSDSHVAVINRTGGTDNLYLLAKTQGQEVTANDVLE